MEPEPVLLCEECGNAPLGDRAHIQGTDGKWIIDGNHLGPSCRNSYRLEPRFGQKTWMFFMMQFVKIMNNCHKMSGCGVMEGINVSFLLFLQMIWSVVALLTTAIRCFFSTYLFQKLNS